MNRSRFLLWVLASGVGVAGGFGLGMAAVALSSAVLPHCGITCDDTLPELLAAAAGYGTWFVVAVVSSIRAWRYLAHK